MRRLLLLASSALFALPLFAAGAALPETSSVLAGAAFIKSTQTGNGIYGSDSPGQMADAILAVRAAGYDPAKDTVGGKGPVDFMNATASKAVTPAAAGKAALAAKALSLDPKAVNGTNLIASIEAGFDASTGKYAADDFSQSIAMLGLACTGNSVPAKAADALKATAIADGGGWGFGGTADPDTTAIAVQALLASGVPKTDAAVVAALAHLKATQGNDGGWGFDPTESNASSTAFVLQALIALGENPESATFTKSGATPVSYLVSQQNADGSFQGFDPAFATNQVLPALAGRTFCNAAETPITRLRPVVAVTPTSVPATATPTAASPAPGAQTPPGTTTAAPRPPSAGTGGSADGSNQLGLLVFAGLALMSGSLLALTRRRGQD